MAEQPVHTLSRTGFYGTSERQDPQSKILRLSVRRKITDRVSYDSWKMARGREHCQRMNAHSRELYCHLLLESIAENMNVTEACPKHTRPGLFSFCSCDPCPQTGKADLTLRLSMCIDTAKSAVTLPFSVTVLPNVEFIRTFKHSPRLACTSYESSGLAKTGRTSW